LRGLLKMAFDKWLHLVAGAFVALSALVAGCNPSTALVWSIMAGAGKEIVDFLRYGVFDFADLAATVAGGLVLVGAVWTMT